MVMATAKTMADSAKTRASSPLRRLTVGLGSLAEAALCLGREFVGASDLEWVGLDTQCGQERVH